MSNSIKQWLASSQDYNVGVALFRAYSADVALKAMFAQGFTDYRQSRLVEAMNELCQTIPDTPIFSLPKHEAVVLGKSQMPETRVPQEKDPYYDQWTPLYIQMNNLSARLMDMPDVATRGAAAHEILRLEDACMLFWAKRDYFLRTGLKMDEGDTISAPIVTDVNMLAKRRANVRTYISKAKAELGKDPGNIKAALRLRDYEAELAGIDQRLNQ